MPAHVQNLCVLRHWLFGKSGFELGPFLRAQVRTIGVRILQQYCMLNGLTLVTCCEALASQAMVCSVNLESKVRPHKSCNSDAVRGVAMPLPRRARAGVAAGRVTASCEKGVLARGSIATADAGRVVATSLLYSGVLISTPIRISCQHNGTGSTCTPVSFCGCERCSRFCLTS